MHSETLNKIKDSISKGNNEFAQWNTNYFSLQKDRYLSDIEYFSKLENISNVLEIGAAPFHLSVLLKSIGLKNEILDIAPERFKGFIDEFGLKVHKCNIELDDFPCENESFDLAIFTEVFEHLRINPVETLDKIGDTIKQDGYLYLTTPNFYRIANIINLLRGNGFVNAFREFNKLNTIGHMGHVREYTKNEVIEFIEHSGFTIKEFKYKNAKEPRLFSISGIITRLFKSTKSHMMFLAIKK